MPVPALSPDVIARLAMQPLDGNVRELENLLHRAVALNDGDELHLDLMGGPPTTRTKEETVSPILVGLPDSAPTNAVVSRPAVPADLQTYLDQQEREILVRALQESGFNRTAAAARLGLSLRQIRYRIARLGISTPHGDDGQSGSMEE
jgi:two-component system, NtrC family, response regulator PilR